MRERRDVGDTLIEIVCSVVIIGLAVSALLTSLANAGRAANVQTTAVRADAILREFVDATKFAVRSCADGRATYTVDYPSPDSRFSLSPALVGRPCPSRTAAPTPVTLEVSGPLGVHETAVVEVRTP